MSKKEKRTSILDAVSNWLKLLTLVVLVGEVIMLLAMTQTPVDSSLYVLYPIMMFVLLLVVIVAVIYDRSHVRHSNLQSISANNQALTIDTASSQTATLQEDQNKYTNSLLAYEFQLPLGTGWHEPLSLNYVEYIKDLMMVQIDDEVAFNNKVRNNSLLGSSFVNSNILKISHGDTVVIELDEESTTADVEDRLKLIVAQAQEIGEPMSAEDIVELRKLANQTETLTQIAFNSKMEVMTFAKTDQDPTMSKITLPKFFQTFMMMGSEPIETLIANEDYILWTTSNKLQNVIVQGKRYASFSISRWYQLHNGKKHVYMSSMQWSPEFDPTMNVWERLKTSFESFKIKK